MTTATITSKSQITIPTAVRAELHVGPGDRIEFVRVADGRYEVVAATQDVIEFVRVADGRYEVVAATQDVTRLRGLIKTSKIVTVEEMNAAIKARVGRE